MFDKGDNGSTEGVGESGPVEGVRVRVGERETENEGMGGGRDWGRDTTLCLTLSTPTKTLEEGAEEGERERCRGGRRGEDRRGRGKRAGNEDDEETGVRLGGRGGDAREGEKRGEGRHCGGGLLGRVEGMDWEREEERVMSGELKGLGCRGGMWLCGVVSVCKKEGREADEVDEEEVKESLLLPTASAPPLWTP